MRGIGGSSDGKGKGITAPNPVGQRLAVERAWRQAGLEPGDRDAGRGARHLDAGRRRGRGRRARRGLRGGRRCAGVDRARLGEVATSATSRPPPAPPGCSRPTLALHHKVLPPSLNFAAPNPNIDFAATPVLRQHRAARVADAPAAACARAGVSAFGFGGTNFHVVLEEYVPGRAPRRAREAPFAAVGVPRRPRSAPPRRPGPPRPRSRGALVARRGATRPSLGRRDSGASPTPRPRRCPGAGRARRRPTCARRSAWPSTTATPPSWPTRRARPKAALAAGHAGHLEGAARAAASSCGRGAAAEGRVPLHRPGLAVRQHAAASCAPSSRSSRTTFAEADRVMTPLLGRPLTDYIFVDADGPGRGRAGRGGAAADRDHPAGRARHRHRALTGCSARTASSRTWSWATASASTARWSRRGR